VEEQIITASPHTYSLDVKSNLRLDNRTPEMEMTLERAKPIDDDELMLNSTALEADDYENYDYTEPKLPPSLPNLV